MRTVALFNNKGGVGKTSLAYHLGFMFAELGLGVVLADLDPQANLSSMCLADERVEQLWLPRPRPTVFGALERLKRGVGDLEPFPPEPVHGRVWLVPGDLQLSEIEDDLSEVWPKCLDGVERAFRFTTALHRVVAEAARTTGADLAILDVGPNFGAINRSALIAADFVLVPVAPDLFSVQGLENVGPRIARWRSEWNDRKSRSPELDFALPAGSMTPLGYVVSRHSVLAGGAVKAYQRWIDRMPSVYRTAFGEPPLAGALATVDDPFCLGQLKDYRSLMPMAQEAKKPMFLLKPADGAIGGHQTAVKLAYDDFRTLAREVLTRMGLPAS